MAEKLRLLHLGLLLEYFSLVWMTIECVVSIGAGLFSGSIALVAFGGDSFVELLSSCVVTGHLRRIVGGKSIGFERDTRAEKAEAFLLFSLIPIIGLGAVYSYLSRIQAEASPLGIAVTLGAVVIMPLLWYEKAHIGHATDCLPLTMDAIESATCFLMSVALLTSLLINYIWKISWVDYVATIIILCFIARETLEAISEIKLG